MKKTKPVQQRNREEREKIILESAFNEFAQRGINQTAMTDIAQKADIGVASLYRYFKTKDELAIRCIIQSWEKIKVVFMKRFTTDEYAAKRGLDQCEELFSIFRDSYKTHPSFYVYVYEFDLYIRRNNIGPERLVDYESLIKEVEKTALAAINKGFEDGSIKPELAEQAKAEELYFSLSHALFSLVQKLAVAGNLLEMDTQVSADREIEIVLKMFRYALKA